MAFTDLTSAITAAVAVYGLGAWRAQTAGKRKLELAEEALVLFYEARDAITHVRSPAAFTSEQDRREKLPGESEDEYQSKLRASVILNRLRSHSELFSKINAMRYRFAAVFGPGSNEAFKVLDGMVSRLSVATRMLAHLWSKNPEHVPNQDHYWKNVQQHEAVIWQVDENDEISQATQRMIEEVENVCRPVLAPPPIEERARRWIEQLPQIPKRVSVVFKRRG